MPIVKINVHKVNAERSLKAKGGQIKINNNVSIKDVEDLDFSVEGKKGFKFILCFCLQLGAGLREDRCGRPGLVC